MFAARDADVLLKWTCCPIRSCILNQAHFQLKHNATSGSKFGQEIEIVIEITYVIFYSSQFYTDLLHKQICFSPESESLQLWEKSFELYELLLFTLPLAKYLCHSHFPHFSNGLWGEKIQQSSALSQKVIGVSLQTFFCL